jgi:hypothetical protein
MESALASSEEREVIRPNTEETRRPVAATRSTAITAKTGEKYAGRALPGAAVGVDKLEDSKR